MTRFLEGSTWLVTHEPLKIGSYVVRVRRNRTKGRYVRDVTLVTGDFLEVGNSKM